MSLEQDVIDRLTKYPGVTNGISAEDLQFFVDTAVCYASDWFANSPCAVVALTYITLHLIVSDAAGTSREQLNLLLGTPSSLSGGGLSQGFAVSSPDNSTQEFWGSTKWGKLYLQLLTQQIAKKRTAVGSLDRKRNHIRRAAGFGYGGHCGGLW